MVDRPDFALLGQGRRHERLRAGVRYTMDVYARSVRSCGRSGRPPRATPWPRGRIRSTTRTAATWSPPAWR